MKKLLMIILSFVFLGGAVTGSALLLSGCNYEQSENSQGDILDDNQNNDEEDSSNGDNEDNPENNGDSEAQSTSHNFSVIAQLVCNKTFKMLT